MEFRANDTDELISKAKTDTDIDNKYIDTKRGKGRWDELGD